MKKREKPEVTWRVLSRAVGNKSGIREADKGQTGNIAC